MSAVSIGRIDSPHGGWASRPFSHNGYTPKDTPGVGTLDVGQVVGPHRIFEGIVGNSPVLWSAIEQAELVAPTGSTVMIYGETGTGKELIADAIHNLSPRRHHSFIKINCAAIPPTLFESELFGHERGAFTGAINQRAGHLEDEHAVVADVRLAVAQRVEEQGHAEADDDDERRHDA